MVLLKSEATRASRHLYRTNRQKEMHIKTTEKEKSEMEQKTDRQFEISRGRGVLKDSEKARDANRVGEKMRWWVEERERDKERGVLGSNVKRKPRIPLYLWRRLRVCIQCD